MSMHKVLFLLISSMAVVGCSSAPTNSTSPYDSESDSSGNGSSHVDSSKGDVAGTVSPLCEEQKIVCPQGEMGTQGAKGDKGESGETGAQGLQGEPGIAGATGAMGAQGPKGETGEAGPKGATGSQGATGAMGPQGNQGAQGTKGDKGDKGDAGKDGVFSKAGMYWVTASGTSPVGVTNGTARVTAVCDPGDILITGGCFGTNPNAVLRYAGTAEAAPNQPESWVCEWQFSFGGTMGSANARCLTVN